MERLSNRGESLITVLAASAVAAVVMGATFQMLSNLFRSTRGAEFSGDINVVRTSILEQVDCEGTFKSAGVDPNDPKVCNSSSALGAQDRAGVFLRLRRKTRDGSIQYLTGPLVKGYSRLGQASIRVTCSASEQSLVIRTARPVGDSFQANPLTRQLASWDGPKALLYGGIPESVPLCYSSSASSKKQINMVIGFNVLNNNQEFIELDLTTPTPTITGRYHGDLHNFKVTEPFASGGTILASVALQSVDVRVGYSNVTAAPRIFTTYPAPGRVRFALQSMGDIESPGGSNPVKGSVFFQVTAVQY